MTFSASYKSPIGQIHIQASAEVITGIVFSNQPVVSNPNRLTDLTILQLDQYFAKKRKSFELPIEGCGTRFQQEVLRLVADIPFGQTVSYSALSKHYGDEKAIRAVAAANGKNKFAIIIPCHRVIGTNGKLTGYAWGLEKKEWLLRHEEAIEQTLF